MDDTGSRKPERASRQPPEHLVVGRAIRPHGVRGTLLVQVFSEIIRSITPSSKVFMGPTLIPAVVRSIRRHRGRFLLDLEGCTDRQQAEQWRGVEIHVRFDEAQPLAEGEYYHWQILGIQVMTEDGATLGQVVDIIETGANDVYVVRGDAGKELLLPATEEVILDVKPDEECMLVRLLPGLRPEVDD